MKQKMNLSFQAEIEVSCQEFAFYLAFALSIHCACTVQVVNSFSSKAEALRFSDKVYQLLGVSEKQQRGPTTCQKHYKKKLILTHTSCFSSSNKFTSNNQSIFSLYRSYIQLTSHFQNSYCMKNACLFTENNCNKCSFSWRVNQYTYTAFKPFLNVL